MFCVKKQKQKWKKNTFKMITIDSVQDGNNMWQINVQFTN